MELPPTERFSSRVDAYTKGRPGYAPAAIEALLAQVPAKSRVVDIGAGTGISSRALAAAGYEVVALEPNEAMRNAIGEASGLTVRSGTAEETGLPGASFDMATAFQAAHWFGKGATDEIRRILVPNGAVALVWNERINVDLGAEYQQIVAKYRRHVPGARDGSQTLPTIDRFFGSKGYEKWTFDNPQLLDLEGFVERAASASYMPNRGDANFDPMREEMAEVFSRYERNGNASMPQVTEVFFGRV